MRATRRPVPASNEDAMIEVVAYKPEWPEEFCCIASTLGEVLGVLALRIDHIGSTSVPELQPRTSSTCGDGRRAGAGRAVGGSAERSRLHAGAGKRQRPSPAGRDGAGHRLGERYARPPAGQRRTNVHIRVQGRPNHRYALLFRDYLRAHPAAAAVYAEVKRQLAAHHPDDIQAYVTIKDPVCDVIMSAAEEWATATGWRVETAVV